MKSVKIAILGDQCVGKSSIITNWIGNSNINYKIVSHHKIKYKISLFDKYFNVDTFILVYDITNKKSFEQLYNWYTKILSINPNIDHNNIILLGHKSDLSLNRYLEYYKVKQYADQLGIRYFESSIYQPESIILVFYYLIDNYSRQTTEQTPFITKKRKMDWKSLFNCSGWKKRNTPTNLRFS